MGNMRISVRIMVFAMVFLLVAGATAEAYTLGGRTLLKGAQGEDVADLQAFLNSQGHDSGPVDGIFGPLTYGGVVRFQHANSLFVDGIAGPHTFALVMEMKEQEEETVTTSTAAPEIEIAVAEEPEANEFNFSAAEIDLFNRIVHAEAEGESFEGKVAVAASILNRVRSTLYPNTLPGVINQVVGGSYQYSPVLDGRINRPASDSAKRAVQEALNGRDPSNGATGFFNPRKTNNRWVRSRPVTIVIGNHVFFK